VLPAVEDSGLTPVRCAMLQVNYIIFVAKYQPFFMASDPPKLKVVLPYDFTSMHFFQIGQSNLYISRSKQFNSISGIWPIFYILIDKVSHVFFFILVASL